MRTLFLLVILLGLTACSDPEESTLAPDTGCQDCEDMGLDVAPEEDMTELPALPVRRVVTADWLAGSLSVFDYDKLIEEGSDAQSALVRQIDLSAWSPGPLQLELSPDKRHALVSISPGFFDSGAPNALIGSPDVPEGGALLWVDLEAGEVVTDFQTPEVAMGLAISPDGKRGYSANFGTSNNRGESLTILNLEDPSVMTSVVVGRGPEQVSLSQDGSLGLVNLASGGGARLFETSDVEGTLSEVIPTGDDPSDVVFLEDQTRALVTNSQSSTFSIINVAQATVEETLESPSITPYGASLIPGTQEILITASLIESTLTRVDLSTSPATVGSPVILPGGPFPMVAAVDPEGRFAFVPHPKDQTLSLINLETGQARSLSWLDAPGPTYAVVQF